MTLLRRDTRMRIARTAAGGMHGGMFQLYRRADIYIDLDAENSGDGSEARPLNSFEALIADDEVECTCRALCCDKIVVRVKGTLAAPVDGNGRDYGGNLAVLPWGAGAQITMTTTQNLDSSPTHNTGIVMFKNLHGVLFYRTTLASAITITKDTDSEIDSNRYKIATFFECKNIEARNSSLSIFATFNVETRPGLLPGPPSVGVWISVGGAGGGLYPWPEGSSPGRPSNQYNGGGIGGEPPDPPDPPGAKVAIVFDAACFLVCESPACIDSGLKVEIYATSKRGCRAAAHGVLSCPFPRVRNSTIAVDVETLHEAGGEVKDGKIAGFGLIAASTASGIGNCQNAAIENTSVYPRAKATCTPTNYPTNDKIGGGATAMALGAYLNINMEANRLTARPIASAKHPVRWSAITAGAHECTGAVITESTLPAYNQQSQGV